MAIVSGSKRLSLYILYRPPPSVKNGLSVAQFFDEFTDFMDNELLLAQSDFVLVGDFNFHMEENSDSNAKRFRGLISSSGLAFHSSRKLWRKWSLRDCETTWPTII